ncbi:Predicted O-linked N-acetylglucosamine transferase, SPINDLY family [Roseateles sp. YR242]|uniref:O-linked N-acetylglucosamine transferase family protein n=1 Tax=Roseateles sp. YR242 TaxID=1855305 RepID=UPI0008B94DB7|nr:tetratricopeptide repeat protein [Roseateles sp. YR242]SEK78991.1 Predicted O-linked N-acetylglucosamine transferase, SPINDLY family [Roseateles sp. YR242]
MSVPQTSRAQAALKKASSAFQRSQWAEAVKGFQDVVRHEPDYFDAYPLLASALERAGQPQRSVELLMAATQRFPQEPTLYLRLGNLMAGAGDWARARQCFERASQLAPQDARSAYNWGVALQELGQPAEAIGAFERAITADPAYTAAYLALGLAYQATGAMEAALMALDCAINITPADPRLHIERARTLLAMGQLPELLAALTPLAERFPAEVEIQNLRGIALKQSGRADEALAAFSAALQIRPDAIEPLHNRANLQLLARRFSPALEDFNRLESLKPDLDWLPGLHLYTAMHLYDWRGFDQRLGAILQGLAEQRRAVQPLILQGLVDDPAAHQQAARLWMNTVSAPAQALPLTTNHQGADHPKAKLRIAYISRDFRTHPVAFLMAEVLELHDRERFEVIAINYGAARNDAMQQRLRAGVDGFMDVAHLSDRQIAQACRELKIDVAVDLTGFTEGARSGIFAQRAAPVQVLYLGYLGTSGTALYDYLIADPLLIPPQTRAFYDERLLVLPSYQANDRQRPRPALHTSRSELGLPDDAFVFCCFNNPSKITPAVFQRWAAILAQVPGSVLWVLEEDAQAAGHLCRHADALGIGAHRLVFAERAPREVYLERLQMADLFLDTLPYNAGTTASDALWMGLPVLTQLGQSFCGRMAASLLHAVGLPSLVAEDAEAYVATAVRLALAPGSLAAIRHRLKTERLTLPLFDTPAFTRTLERAFGEAHRARSAGEPLQDIHISPAAQP